MPCGFLILPRSTNRSVLALRESSLVPRLHQTSKGQTITQIAHQKLLIGSESNSEPVSGKLAMASLWGCFSRLNRRAARSTNPALEHDGMSKTTKLLQKSRTQDSLESQHKTKQDLSRKSSTTSTLLADEGDGRNSVQGTSTIPKGIVYGARDWRKYSVGSQSQ